MEYNKEKCCIHKLDCKKMLKDKFTCNFPMLFRQKDAFSNLHNGKVHLFIIERFK